jgi:DNA-binding NtrC family response regulator
MEKELLIRALEKFNGNQTHAAKYPDISRKALRYRMEKYGIPKKGVEVEEDEQLDRPEDVRWK